mmetsp:Transcript_49444/g.142185  ORF Transcript_49444/g.142185 Transcript_49444/m.142185 type:complete len:286 (-) Transcript_49444:78-935(-)
MPTRPPTKASRRGSARRQAWRASAPRPGHSTRRQTPTAPPAWETRPAPTAKRPRPSATHGSGQGPAAPAAPMAARRSLYPTLSPLPARGPSHRSPPGSEGERRETRSRTAPASPVRRRRRQLRGRGWARRTLNTPSPPRRRASAARSTRHRTSCRTILRCPRGSLPMLLAAQCQAAAGHQSRRRGTCPRCRRCPSPSPLTRPSTRPGPTPQEPIQERPWRQRSLPPSPLRNLASTRGNRSASPPAPPPHNSSAPSLHPTRHPGPQRPGTPSVSHVAGRKACEPES